MARQTPIYVEVDRIHYPVYFTRRPPYTWAYVTINGERRPLGDVGPGVPWTTPELVAAIARQVAFCSQPICGAVYGDPGRIPTATVG